MTDSPSTRRTLADTAADLWVMGVVGSLIGASMALAASAFVWGIRVFTQWREHSLGLEIAVAGSTLEITPLVALWIAAILVIAIRRGFQIQRWHGPADAIFAAHQPGNTLDVKQGLASTLTAFVGASGGASVGQYGPLVHFGATAGAWIQKRITSRLTPETYLGCGVAAAISAGFGAPLAGIVFAHEAVLRHFSVRAMAPIAIASVTASALNAAIFPSISGFDLAPTAPDLGLLIPILIAASPLMAAAALLYMTALLKVSAWASKAPYSPDALIVLAATGCGLVGLWLPEILGVGVSTMNGMLNGEYGAGMLLTLLVMKIAMTALCIGCGLFGGTFSPALFVGIAAGGLIGTLATFAGAPDLSLALAVASMAAVVSALIGAPIAAVLIALELTHSYAFGVAALTAVVATTVWTHRLFGHSFYDRQLLERGIDLSAGREALARAATSIASCPVKPGVRVSTEASAAEALDALTKANHTEGYLLTDDGRLAGKITLHQLLKHPNEPALTRADRAPLTLTTALSLDVAMERLADFVGESVPVVDPGTDRFLGILAEGDVFRALQSVHADTRDRERN